MRTLMVNEIEQVGGAAHAPEEILGMTAAALGVFAIFAAPAELAFGVGFVLGGTLVLWWNND